LSAAQPEVELVDAGGNLAATHGNVSVAAAITRLRPEFADVAAGTEWAALPAGAGAWPFTLGGEPYLVRIDDAGNATVRARPPSPPIQTGRTSLSALRKPDAQRPG